MREGFFRGVGGVDHKKVTPFNGGTFERFPFKVLFAKTLVFALFYS